MSGKINRHSFWLVCFCAVIVIGITGCGEDDNNPLVEDKNENPDDENLENENPWVGTWVFETIDGKHIQALFDALAIVINIFAAFEEGDAANGIEILYTDLWTFNNDRTWRREVTIIAPNEEGIVETISIRAEGPYVLSGSQYVITPESVTFPEGFEFPDEEHDTVGELDSDYPIPQFGYEAETGTWSVNGCDLTLTSDTGAVIGFRKP